MGNLESLNHKFVIEKNHKTRHIEKIKNQLQVTKDNIDYYIDSIGEWIFAGAFDQALAYAQAVLNFDPLAHQVYAYLILIERRLRSFDELLERLEVLDQDLNYKKAVHYGNTEIRDLNTIIKDKIFEETLSKAYYEGVYAYLEQDYFNCKVKTDVKLKEAELRGHTHSPMYEKLRTLKSAADMKYVEQKEEYIKFYKDELTSLVYFRNILIDVDLKYETHYSNDLEKIIEIHHRYLRSISQGHFVKKKYDMTYEREMLMSDISHLVEGYSLFDQEEYHQAYDHFTKIGEFFDTREITNKTMRLSKLQDRYHYALDELKAHHYYRAMNAFSVCQSYKEGQSYYKEARNDLIGELITYVKVIAIIDVIFLMCLLYIYLPK